MPPLCNHPTLQTHPTTLEGGIHIRMVSVGELLFRLFINLLTNRADTQQPYDAARMGTRPSVSITTQPFNRNTSTWDAAGNLDAVPTPTVIAALEMPPVRPLQLRERAQTTVAGDTPAAGPASGTVPSSSSDRYRAQTVSHQTAYHLPRPRPTPLDTGEGVTSSVVFASPGSLTSSPAVAHPATSPFSATSTASSALPTPTSGQLARFAQPGIVRSPATGTSPKAPWESPAQTIKPPPRTSSRDKLRTYPSLSALSEAAEPRSGGEQRIEVPPLAPVSVGGLGLNGSALAMHGVGRF
jgi:hypothetical protein